MATPPRQPFPLGAVPSLQEMDALRDIAHHRKVLPQMYRILKNIGLVEQQLGGWVLTQAGQIRLQRGAAR
jgi:ribosomal protein S19E (S16A)